MPRTGPLLAGDGTDDAANDDAADDAANGAGKRDADDAELDAVPAEETADDWAAVLSSVRELCGSLCRLINEEAADRAAAAAARERVADEAAAAAAEEEQADENGGAGQGGKRGRKGKHAAGKKGGKAGRAKLASPGPLDETVEPLTAEDVLPAGSLVALLAKAPNTAVRASVCCCRCSVCAC